MMKNKLSVVRFAVVSFVLALAALSPLAVIAVNGPDAHAAAPAPLVVAPPIDAATPSFPAPPALEEPRVVTLAEVVVTGREARPTPAPARSEAPRAPSCHNHRLAIQTQPDRYPGDLRTSGETVRVCD